MTEVFLEPALRKTGRYPPIEDQVLDVPEIAEVGKEGIQVTGVDPPAPRRVSLS